MPETRRLTHSTCWLASVGEVVAVEDPVLGMEGVGDSSQRGVVEVALGHRHPDLEGLPEVAHVGRPGEDVLLGRETLLGQRLGRLRG